MDEKNKVNEHLKIGIIGNPQGGRAKLIQEITKILKEENDKKFNDETKSQLTQVNSKKFLNCKDFEKLSD